MLSVREQILNRASLSMQNVTSETPIKCFSANTALYGSTITSDTCEKSKFVQVRTIQKYYEKSSVLGPDLASLVRVQVSGS